MHFLHKQNASSRAGGPEDPRESRSARDAALEAGDRLAADLLGLVEAVGRERRLVLVRGRAARRRDLGGCLIFQTDCLRKF